MILRLGQNKNAFLFNIHNKLSNDCALNKKRLIESKRIKQFTEVSAYQYVMHADTLAFPRDMMARCNIHEYLEPNLFPDSAKTLAAREDVLSSVSPTAGMVQSGQRIIDRGEIISAEQYQILQSFQHETERRNDPSEGFWLILAGQVLFVSALLVAFFFYLNLFRRDYLRSRWPHS